MSRRRRTPQQIQSSVTLLDVARAVYEEAQQFAETEEEAEALANAALWGAVRHLTPAPTGRRTSLRTGRRASRTPGTRLKVAS